MDLTTALITGIATLGAVIPILWLTLRGVERRFGRKLAESEMNCRIDLTSERLAREGDQERLRKLEGDVRAILIGEVHKATSALVIVGEKLGQMIDRIDEISEQLDLPPRNKDHDPQRATTALLAAISGPKS